MQEAREMLRRWEAGDPEVVALWEMMNQWVYEGFDETYKKLGITFDKVYYESQTYLVGKEMVLEGVKKSIFYQKEDGSVWADLTPYGLDHKLLLRADGTSVYITQDIGTAKLRFDDYPIDKNDLCGGQRAELSFSSARHLARYAWFQIRQRTVAFFLWNGRTTRRENEIARRHSSRCR